ncbi:uncharacterized protein LOC119577542 [Penaeus monodon]|uniref:uncharacterized protein LOC119577542 n=1 Tax=Penaeus monodon TaxID=6687 RepID=UPI0018A770C2|nr:uncharacterized protein LOC119577542 [Penaeus monodon]
MVCVYRSPPPDPSSYQRYPTKADKHCLFLGLNVFASLKGRADTVYFRELGPMWRRKKNRYDLPQRRNNVMVHKKKNAIRVPVLFESYSPCARTSATKSLQLPHHGLPSQGARGRNERNEVSSEQRRSSCHLTSRRKRQSMQAERGGTPKEEKEEQEHESVLWRRISLAPLCPRLGGGAPPAGHGLLIEDGSVGCPHSLTQREGEKALLRSLGFGPRRGAARMAVTSLLSPLGVGARPLLRHQVAGAWASPRDAVPMGSRSLLLITN